MNSKKKPKKSNNQLRYERELQGWTQEQVADKLFDECGPGERGDINSETVGRWERGVSKPSPRYVAALCRIFGKNAEELGVVERLEGPEPSQTITSPLTSSPWSVASGSSIGLHGVLAPENNEAMLQFDKQIQGSAYSPPVAIVQSMTPGAGNQAGVSLGILRGMPGVYIPLHQAFDVLYPKSGAALEQPEEAGIALLAGELAPLFHLGWSIDEVLDAQRIMVEGIQAMPESVRKMISRRTMLDRFLKLTATAMIGSIPMLSSEKHVSSEERNQLHTALGENISEAWKRFTTASMSQVLVIGHAQLQVIRYVHEELYPAVRPLFYSPVYRLIGAALFFQSRYAEAMHFHKQAYITAVEACDPWNMAESLSWQAGVLKACGRHSESIQTTEAALHLLNSCDDSRALTSRARFLAHWAESAALLGERDIMDEKLAASAELLNQFEGNDEFDFAIWQLYRGTCALYSGDFLTADIYLQQALQNLKPNLFHQCASTRLLQAQARLKTGDGKGSLEAARIAVPLVEAADSPLLFYGFVDHVQDLTAAFPRDAQVKDFAKEVQQHLQVHALHAHRPRYLEAAL